MVDAIDSLSFDTSQERVIEIGTRERLAVADAEKAKTKLKESLKVVLADGYVASSLVSEAAGSRSLQDLAPDNPIATELAHVREGVQTLLRRVQPDRQDGTNFQDDAYALWALIESLGGEGKVTYRNLDEADIAERPISDSLRISLEGLADRDDPS